MCFCFGTLGIVLIGGISPVTCLSAFEVELGKKVHCYVEHWCGIFSFSDTPKLALSNPFYH